MQTLMKSHPKGNTLNISDYGSRGKDIVDRGNFHGNGKWFCVDRGLMRCGK